MQASRFGVWFAEKVLTFIPFLFHIYIEGFLTFIALIKMGGMLGKTMEDNFKKQQDFMLEMNRWVRLWPQHVQKMILLM